MLNFSQIIPQLNQLILFRDMPLSPKDQYRMNLLRIIIYVNLMSLPVFSFLSVIIDLHNKITLFLVLLAIFFVNIGALYLLRKGDISKVGCVIVGFTWGLLAFVGYLSGGLYSSMSLIIMLLAIIANFLLDLKSRLIVYALTIAYFIGLFFIEVAGYLPYSPASDLLFRVSLLSITLTILYLLVNYHLYAFRQSEDQNLALQVNAERDRVQRQLTQDLAHDLRTPLTTLRTSLDLVKMRQARGLPIDDTLERLEKQSMRLSTLVDDLFQMTMLDDANPQQKLQSVPLTDLIKQSIDDVTAYATIRTISVSFCNQSEDPIIFADESQMKRAVINLLENAIHYGRDNGFVTVTLSKDDACSIIKIADNGIGIAPEHQAKVFERFYRVDEARTARDSVGSGVGLNAVQRIVQLHGGRIELTSELGKGSIFTVYLPYLKPVIDDNQDIQVTNTPHIIN